MKTKWQIMNNRQFTSLLFRLLLGFVYLSAGLSKLGTHLFGNVIGPVDTSEFWNMMHLPQYTA